MKLINKIPLPITGLILGLAALGNLVMSYSLTLRYVFGSISAILFIAVILKILFNYDQFKEDLQHPVVASVFPTFTMALMVLSTYVVKVNPSIAEYMYLTGICLHMILIVVFTFQFVSKFNIKKVFPSYFIVYVGIVVGSVCAPPYQLQELGQVLFWFGFITYFIVLAAVSYRVIVVKNIPEPALPTLVIYAAPASLLLAGYNASFADKNQIIHLLLVVLSLGFYLYAFVKLYSLLKLKFYPSYSAFTFPYVISAIAIKTTKIDGINLSAVATFQTVVAFILVVYVLIRYCLFLSKK